MLYSLEDYKPQVHQSCFVADSAEVIGRVHLAEGSSVWFQAVLRGDNDDIHVGEGSNIQDGVIIHVDPGYPCQVGKGSVVGHRAVLHGCTIGDGCLIGIGATLLNGAVVPDNCLVGAGALVTEGKRLEEGYLYMGVPARKMRALSEQERTLIAKNVAGYQKRAELYRKNLSREA
ncbi:MAG: gamma carbonic anhydrase family protein [Candidatus Eremiobacteraeota bacterium]|nr:gamma carbonic anhydrase family protein [Candidatus Eremiobacteraeota bacterium]